MSLGWDWDEATIRHVSDSMELQYAYNVVNLDNPNTDIPPPDESIWIIRKGVSGTFYLQSSVNSTSRTLGLNYRATQNALSGNAGYNIGFTPLDNTPALGFSLIPHATESHHYYVTMLSVDQVPLYCQQNYSGEASPSYNWFSKDANRQAIDWRRPPYTGPLFPTPNWDELSVFKIIDIGSAPTVTINNSIVFNKVQKFGTGRFQLMQLTRRDAMLTSSSKLGVCMKNLSICRPLINSSVCV